ncbi:SH3 domain-containing protein [Candidatus Nomurabacteria bacterium]|nr:SH3 domain-containing protein [Candidatus Nomurabacteria bacterium]
MNIDRRIAFIGLLVAISSLIVGIKQCQLAMLSPEKEVSLKSNDENTSPPAPEQVQEKDQSLSSNNSSPSANDNTEKNKSTTNKDKPVITITKKQEPLYSSSEPEKKHNTNTQLKDKNTEPPIMKVEQPEKKSLFCVYSNINPDADVQLYDAPVNNSDPKLAISPGTKVTRLKELNGWCKIETPNGRTGWVNQNKLVLCQQN